MQPIFQLVEDENSDKQNTRDLYSAQTNFPPEMQIFVSLLYMIISPKFKNALIRQITFFISPSML